LAVIHDSLLCFVLGLERNETRTLESSGLGRQQNPR